jgi:serine/threonine protein kinase
MSNRTFQPSDISFSTVADYFVSEIRNGKSPTIDSFVKAFPHLEKVIRTSFPALLVLEKTVGNRVNPRHVAAGLSFGKCIVQEEIGRGAMGVVYKGLQKEFGRIVAIKAIPLCEDENSGVLKRFELERKAMARLEHSNIVPIYEYGSNEQHAYIVMKYIDGQSLDKILCPNAEYRAKALLTELQSDWKAFSALGAKIASGLQHAHEQGLVHRDIKPANLLLDHERKIWLTDFGLAKVYDQTRSLSRTGDAIGTPRYMAPEQLRGNCDCRSDIYSLGITLYELATGSRAWPDHSFEALTQNREALKLNSIHDVNPDIPEPLAKIIMKACAFSPEERYQTAKEMQFVLERFASGITPSDRRRRRREPDALYRKRSKQTASLMIGLAGAMLVLTMVFQQQPRQMAYQAPASKNLPKGSNFLEALGNLDGGDFNEAVVMLIREAIENASVQFRLDESDKSEIISNAEEILTCIKEQKLDRNTIDSFLQGYRESTFPAGTQILSLSRFVERSSLNPTDAEMAYNTLKTFAKLVINRHIPETEAYTIIASLTAGRVLTVEEIGQTELLDEKLSSWLMLVRNRISQVSEDSLKQKMDVSAEIQRAFQATSKSSRLVKVGKQ